MDLGKVDLLVGLDMAHAYNFKKVLVWFEPKWSTPTCRQPINMKPGLNRPLMDVKIYVLQTKQTFIKYSNLEMFDQNLHFNKFFDFSRACQNFQF